MIREMDASTLPAFRGYDAGDQVASLQATLGRFEHALGVLSEAIVWTDGRGLISWCNPAFERLSMRQALSMVGLPIEDALTLESHGSIVKPAEHPVRRALSGGGQGAGRTVIEAYQTSRGGQRRFLEVHGACLRGGSGLSAMMVVRDNTERYLAESWLEAEGRRSELMRAVAAASNHAEDPQLALETGLKLICGFLGWPLGRAVLIGPGGAPVCELWFPERPATGSGAVASGLSNRAIETGQAVWAAAAVRDRLESALALPVKSQGETRAVLEFFTAAPAPGPDPESEPLFEQIGAQLGRVFERERSRFALLRAKEDLERRVAERTTELMTLNASLELEIASRERFQTALRESMDRYRSLMQSVRDVIFAISGRGRVESLNSAFDALTGLRWKDQVMERVIPLIHKEDRKTAALAFRKTLAGKRVPPFEIRVRHANGDWIFFECSLTLQLKPGQTPGVAGIARDVTESRRAKAELVVRDRAMAATTEGIAITDAQAAGNPISFANSGFERLTGYAASEAIGKGIEELLRGPGTSPETSRRIDQALAECQALTVEMLAHHKNGKTFWICLVITPVFDDRRRPSNFVAILSDISPQKEAERMKNEFVSTVSHELRTPLTSLRGFAELMLEREYPPEKQKKFIQIIHRESTRLGNLINDFLDVQRMEAGRQDYRLAKTPIGQILHDTAALFRPTSPIHQFDLECEANLPDVRADADRLRQITTNLLSNAVKFSPKGGRVLLQARRDGAMVEIAISDQGIGIPAGAIDKLFGKFYRVDNTETRKIGGTGLGLSIVKQIVEAHGGAVRVESAFGHGSSIIFTLPVFAA